MALASHGRYVPGPAGLLRRLETENAAPAAIQAALNEALRPQHAACSWSRVLPAVAQDLGAAYPSWAAACAALEVGPADAVHPMLAHDIASILRQAKTHKVPQLLAVVQSLEYIPTGGAHLILKDRSGTLKATVHPQVFEQQPKLMAGATIALRQVTVVCALPAMVYMAITTDNITSSSIFLPPAAMAQPNQTQPLRPGQAAQGVHRQGLEPGQSLTDALQPDSPLLVAHERVLPHVVEPAAYRFQDTETAHAVPTLHRTAVNTLPGLQQQGQQQQQQGRQLSPTQQQGAGQLQNTRPSEGRTAPQQHGAALAGPAARADSRSLSAVQLLDGHPLSLQNSVGPPAYGRPMPARSYPYGQASSCVEHQPTLQGGQLIQQQQRQQQQPSLPPSTGTQSNVDRVVCTPQQPAITPSAVLAGQLHQQAAAPAWAQGGRDAAMQAAAGKNAQAHNQQPAQLYSGEYKNGKADENMDDVYGDGSDDEEQDMPQFAVLGVLPAKRQLPHSVPLAMQLAPSASVAASTLQQTRCTQERAANAQKSLPAAGYTAGHDLVLQAGLGNSAVAKCTSTEKVGQASFQQGIDGQRLACQPAPQPVQHCTSPRGMVVGLPQGVTAPKANVLPLAASSTALGEGRPVTSAIVVNEELSMLSGSGKRPRLLSNMKDYLQKPLQAPYARAAGSQAEGVAIISHGELQPWPQHVAVVNAGSTVSNATTASLSHGQATAAVNRRTADLHVTGGAVRPGLAVCQQQLQSNNQTTAPARTASAAADAARQHGSLCRAGSMVGSMPHRLTASQMRSSGGTRPQLNLADDNDDVELYDDD